MTASLVTAVRDEVLRRQDGLLLRLLGFYLGLLRIVLVPGDRGEQGDVEPGDGGGPGDVPARRAGSRGHSGETQQLCWRGRTVVD